MTDREARWWRRLAALIAVELVLLGPFNHWPYAFALLGAGVYWLASGVLHFLVAVPVPRRTMKDAPAERDNARPGLDHPPTAIGR